jgi:uncharacterized protein YndB with AHSA1/START domain
MAQFALVTRWHIEAPQAAVWDAIYASDRWPEWWPYVVSVEELEPGDAEGVGALRRLTWKTRLPYTLSFEVRSTRVEKPHTLEGRASGELEGTGLWRLSSAGAVTVVRYDWTVDVTKPWMALLAPLLAPVFKWNHDAVMRAGGEGLAKRLGAKLLRFEKG